MKTVLNVKTDQEIKEKAQALSKHLGVPLSTVVNAYLKEFIQSGVFTLSREPHLKASVLAELHATIAESEEQTNLSPVFTDADTAIDWLRS